MLFSIERKILRKISGPIKNSDESWRIRANNEITECIHYKNITNFVVSNQLRWFVYLHKMQENIPFSKNI